MEEEERVERALREKMMERQEKEESCIAADRMMVRVKAGVIHLLSLLETIPSSGAGRSESASAAAKMHSLLLQKDDLGLAAAVKKRADGDVHAYSSVVGGGNEGNEGSGAGGVGKGEGEEGGDGGGGGGGGGGDREGGGEGKGKFDAVEITLPRALTVLQARMIEILSFLDPEAKITEESDAVLDGRLDDFYESNAEAQILVPTTERMYPAMRGGISGKPLHLRRDTRKHRAAAAIAVEREEQQVSFDESPGRKSA